MSTTSSVDVAGVLKTLKNSQPKYKNTTIEERIALLQKLKKAILAHKDAIVDAMYKDFGRPEMEAIVEIGTSTAEIDVTCKNLPEWSVNPEIKPEILTTGKAKVVYEPKGTVLIIGPWNFPFCLVMNPLVAVIATGNNAIIKPSELTPHVSTVIKDILDTTFEEDHFVTIEGGVDITTELLKLPFDHIFFTGSPNVGKIVMEAAAKNLTSVTLELGGKSPVILDKTADLDKAVKLIMRGKTTNAGQICISPDFIYLPKELQNSFVEKAKAFIEEGFYQDGVWLHHDYTQIINERNYDRIKGLFDDAVEKGATVAYGGIFDQEARRIHPTILTNVPADAKIMKEEIFGPLLPVLDYEGADATIEHLKNFEKPLALYIFSRDQEQIDYLIKNTTSGGICVNDVLLHCAETALPFGGVNNSGIGKYHGIYGFQELSNAKGVFFRNVDEEISPMELPPYAGKAEVLSQYILNS